MNAYQAAKSLSKLLALPATRATVFAWHDSKGDALVVAGDRSWLMAFREVPTEHLGFRVVVQDSLDAIPHVRLH